MPRWRSVARERAAEICCFGFENLSRLVDSAARLDALPRCTASRRNVSVFPRRRFYFCNSRRVDGLMRGDVRFLDHSSLLLMMIIDLVTFSMPRSHLLPFPTMYGPARMMLRLSPSCLRHFNIACNVYVLWPLFTQMVAGRLVAPSFSTGYSISKAKGRVFAMPANLTVHLFLFPK